MNSLCKTPKAVSMFLLSITQETLIGEVEIIEIFIEFSPKILNIFEATPDSDFIPAPIIETLPTFSSMS